MTMYINNRLDNKVERTFDEILDGFSKSIFATENYPTRQGLSLYIGTKDGLNSSFDVKEFEDLLEYRMQNR